MQIFELEFMIELKKEIILHKPFLGIIIFSLEKHLFIQKWMKWFNFIPQTFLLGSIIGPGVGIIKQNESCELQTSQFSFYSWTKLTVYSIL